MWKGVEDQHIIHFLITLIKNWTHFQRNFICDKPNVPRFCCTNTYRLIKVTHKKNHFVYEYHTSAATTATYMPYHATFISTLAHTFANPSLLSVIIFIVILLLAFVRMPIYKSKEPRREKEWYVTVNKICNWNSHLDWCCALSIWPCLRFSCCLIHCLLIPVKLIYTKYFYKLK